MYAQRQHRKKPYGFDNANMDLELITSAELWDVFAQGYCIYGVKNVHIRILLSFLLSTRFGGADCVLCHRGWLERKSVKTG